MTAVILNRRELPVRKPFVLKTTAKETRLLLTLHPATEAVIALEIAHPALAPLHRARYVVLQITALPAHALTAQTDLQTVIPILQTAVKLG